MSNQMKLRQKVEDVVQSHATLIQGSYRLSMRQRELAMQKEDE